MVTFRVLADIFGLHCGENDLTEEATGSSKTSFIRYELKGQPEKLDKLFRSCLGGRCVMITRKKA